MKVIQVTQRIGENMGPIDWAYDFRPHFDSRGAPDAEKDRICARQIGWLRAIDEAFRAGHMIHVTDDGGSPRCGIYPVIDVGMYDGWPYWRPVPSVCVMTHFGSSWMSFHSITNVYPSGPNGAALP